jgi:hypothetical protein
MTKVYGCSDDLLEIDPAPYPADEIGYFDSDVFVRFSDNTLIKASYGKNGKGIWCITVLEKGTVKQALTECDDEDAKIYSDIFEIDADYVWHEVKEI